MKATAISALVAAMLATTFVFAAAPEGVPSGTTAVCKDGTFWSNVERKGACRGHKGVKEWIAQEDTPASKAAPAAATAPAAAAPMSTARVSTPAMAKTAPAAVAGAAGQVWTNDGTKTYHCNGDRWYGKTKHGEYMTEGEAKAKGFHPDHGKACS